MLTGGYTPPDPVRQLIDGVQQDLPILVTTGGTFETASTLARVQGPVDRGLQPVKLETALRVFAESVDARRVAGRDRRRRIRAWSPR